MRRIPAAAASAAIALLLLAPPASAAKPFMVRISEPATLVLPAGDFCTDFDVRVDAEQNFKFIAFSGHRGTLWTGLTVGGLKAELTNLVTDESISITIPGPGFIDAAGNTITGTGPWLVFIPGEVLYLVGHITFAGTQPFVVPTEVRGRTVDLCEALG
jgi:hypothetical protein